MNGRTRAIGLLIALLLIAALTTACMLTPAWRLYALLPPERLSSDRLRVTQQLAARWRDDPPDVLFIGGSQIRESLPDEQFMTRYLSQACGRPVRVFNATSSAQPPESSWRVLEVLEPRAPPLVVSGVNLSRVSGGHANTQRLARALLPIGAPKRLAADHGALDIGMGARLKNAMGIAFADTVQAIRFAAPRVDDPFQGAHNQYRKPVWSEDRKRIELEYTLLVGSQTDDTVLDANVGFYRELATFARERGGHPVFLLPPAMSGGARHAALDARLQARLDLLDASDEVIDLRAVTTLAGDDFFDPVHLVAEGRRKLWPLLAAALLPRIPGCPAVP